jgi:hypothetical protein
MRRLAIAVAVVAAVAISAGTALAAGTKTSVIYDSSAKSGPPSNLPSAGPEAYAFWKMFERIDFVAGPRKLSNVTVTLSSWACVSGAWYSDDCSTPAGATFPQAVTLEIYDARAWQDTGGNTPPIASSTQTFNIPYRPSASPQCTGGNAGKWYSAGTKTCFNGLANDVTFNFGSTITLPNSVVYAISYNTTHYGPSPVGEGAACFGTPAGCPYDALNIALNNTPNTVLGYAYYWGVFPGYTPAVQFKAAGGS